MARAWDDVLTDLDRAVYQGAGFGARGGGGRRPALLVIDVTYDFVGDQPEPILESIKKFPSSCGEAGWRGMAAIRELQELCRELQVPIFYTRNLNERSALTRGSWGWKKDKAVEQRMMGKWDGNQIPDLVAPREGEVVIQKTKPSAFFSTPLASYLVGLRVDTVLVTGCTTSGCIRASVIDAFSNNFRTIIVEDGVWDRAETPHKINLFDMQSKYGDVVPLEEAKRYLHSLQPALAAELPAR
ncbi:MAG: isochorismatase family protein [Chloroflexi bacterium]|nr:isochorismatase family protein [Chloroflexota bacterium]